jgi:hypothetical protein
MLFIIIIIINKNLVYYIHNKNFITNNKNILIIFLFKYSINLLTDFNLLIKLFRFKINSN